MSIELNKKSKEKKGEWRCSCGRLLFKGAFIVGVIEAKCPRCKRIVCLQEIENINNSEEGFMAILSLEGIILSINSHSGSLLGYEAKSLSGVNIADAMPSEYRTTVPFWLEKIGDAEGLENPYVLAIIPILNNLNKEVKISFAAKRVELDGQKVIIAVAEVGEHVVEGYQKRIEDGLACSTNRRHEAWDLIVDPSGTIIHTGSEKILGHKRDELIGDNVLRLIKSSDISTEQLKIKLKNLESFSFQAEIESGRGDVFAAEVCFMKDFLVTGTADQQGIIVAFKFTDS